MDTIINFVVVALLIVSVIGISVLLYLLSKANNEKKQHQKTLSRLRKEFHNLVQKGGQELLESWRKSELDNLRNEMRKNFQESIDNEYKVKFDTWKKEYEKTIRKDAVSKSRSTLVGKITEHFIPYLPDFPYNPQDARFMGAPIDFIVFDGMSEGELKEVVLVEIKTNKGNLSKRERQLRDAVNEGRVKWTQIRRAVDLDTKK